MRTRIASALLCLLPWIANSSRAAEVAVARVVLVGDSTIAPLSGYGDALCQRFAPTVTCLNLGRAGSSSLSYRTSGLWQAVSALFTKPPYTRSYVLIQFGHNDQPGWPGRSTTLQEFAGNLEQYIREARAVGAQPVLVTPLSRRRFEAGKLVRDLQPWAEATRAVAEQTKTPLVDLHAASVAMLEKLGPTEANTLARGAAPAEAIAAALQGNSAALPRPEPPLRRAFDYTHVGPKGAELFAAMVADELRAVVPALGRRLP